MLAGLFDAPFQKFSSPHTGEVSGQTLHEVGLNPCGRTISETRAVVLKVKDEG